MIAFRIPNLALFRQFAPEEQWNLNWYLWSSLISNIGVWMQRITVAWLMWQLTLSSVWLGLIALVEVIPFISLGLLGGVVIDRSGAERIMAIGLILLGCQAVALASLNAADMLGPGTLLAFVGGGAVVQSAVSPANQTIIVKLFTPENAARTIPLYSVTFNVARFAGPLVTLPLIQVGGVSAVFVANALSYLPAIVALSRFKYRTDPERADLAASPATSSGVQPSLGDDLRIGLAYAMTTPSVRTLLILIFLTSLTGRPFMEMIPAIADLSFRRAGDGAMLLMSAAGIGALIGGISLSMTRGRRARLVALVASNFGLAGALVLLAISQSFGMARIVVSIAGLAAVTNGIVTIVLLQSFVSSHQRGRMTGLYFSSLRSGLAIGALVSGVLVDAWGVAFTLILGGMATAVTAVWSLRFAVCANREPATPSTPATAAPRIDPGVRR